MKNLFGIIEEEAKKNKLTKINRITVQLGQLRQIIPEFLQFALQNIAKNTIADGAELIIETIPVTIYCKKCQQKFSVQEHTYLCPNCTNIDIEVLSGKEIILTSIEGDQ